jgi:hypothetical protein
VNTVGASVLRRRFPPIWESHQTASLARQSVQVRLCVPIQDYRVHTHALYPFRCKSSRVSCTLRLILENHADPEAWPAQFALQPPRDYNGTVGKTFSSFPSLSLIFLPVTNTGLIVTNITFGLGFQFAPVAGPAFTSIGSHEWLTSPDQ